MTAFLVLIYVFCYPGEEESEDEHLQANAEKVIKQEKTGSGNLEAIRRRRSAWGKRKHAATVESIAYRIV